MQKISKKTENELRMMEQLFLDQLDSKLRAIFLLYSIPTHKRKLLMKYFLELKTLSQDVISFLPKSL